MSRRLLHVAAYSPYRWGAGGQTRLAATLAAVSQVWSVDGFYLEDEAGGSIPAQGAPKWRHPTSRKLDVAKRAQHLLAMRLGRLETDFFAGCSAEPISTIRGRAAQTDAVLVEFGQMAPCAPLPAPSVLVAYDLTWMKTLAQARLTVGTGRSRLERWRLSAEAQALFRLETDYYARFEEVVVVSEPDAEVLATAFARAGVSVTPTISVSHNGVDWTAFGEVDEGEDGVAAFVGGLNHLPNASAVASLASDLLPATKGRVSKLLLAGFGTDQVQGPGVVGLGLVRDIRRVYEQASFTVAPITWGSGSRLKIIESLAARRPVVAFTAAAQGLETLWGCDGLIVVDTPAEFVDAVCYLASDPGEARKRGAAGREAAAAFDWSVTLAPVLRALARVSGESVLARAARDEGATTGGT